MKRFVLTRQAEQDLNEIWDYLAADSSEAACRVLDALEEAILRLSRNPGLSHWREDLADKRHRFYLVYSHLIVYRHEQTPLPVVRILHAAQDVQKLLGLNSDEPN